ncbi:MAG: thiamine pyrophosphate-binding protein [Burkholderiales bacterium]|nr:thiamine pyrophosphate-binding protein [Burkholderiales bacterium]
MMTTLRGADILARTLAQAGLRRIFSLSGNHIMPVYDAAIEAKLAITHVRYEGAAVHMADAWARLTGEPGIALLTGGPGHANGVGALYTALASESPLVLLSGHAPLNELGTGSFQEMRQADIAAPLVKAAWTVASVETVGVDIAKACRIARSGRPGPVHLSLPFDVLEAKVADGEKFLAPVADFAPVEHPPETKTIAALQALLKTAARPLILLGPVLAHAPVVGLVKQLSAAAGVPALCMESPRGVNDPGLGAFAAVLARADLVVLIGKQADFTLRFGKAPALAAACRFAVIDPESEALQRAIKNLGAARVALSAQADSVATVRALIAAAQPHAGAAWLKEVADAVAFRPAAWRDINSGDGPVHPVELGRAVQDALNTSPDAVFIADGGEIGQWAQACIQAPARIINGVGGSIGSAVPFAFAARMARPQAPVIAVMGDGAFGFHLMEFDTAVRDGVPMIVVVGNDSCWNAEHQIQLRSYGKERAHGCELRGGTRYDLAVAALGGHGELVTRAAELKPALARAIASGKPACINVMIQRLAAPTVTAGAPAAAH